MELFISEKTWKPIMNYHPFIIMASPFTLKKIRSYGFKTFHPFIDESYDECLDNQQRFLMIEEQIKKLCEMPLEDLHDWYCSIIDTLEFNYSHFYNTFIPNQYKELENEFKNILEG